MPIKIEIDDQKIQHYNRQAINELEIKVSSYIKSILEESDRLESGIRTSSSTSPEITSSIVSDAAMILNRGWGKKPKKNFWIVVITILNTLFAGLFGALLNLDRLSKPENKNEIIYLLLVAILVIFLTGYLTIKDKLSNE